MIKKIFTFTITLYFLSTLTVFSQKLTSGVFGSMNARQIGPSVMSGRITAIDAINDDSRIVYVGSAGGGVWKSITGGTLFKSVFDKYNQSVGALTIDQKNPDVVWVGTGESNMRNSVSIGTGLYKTSDGGESWELMGLEKTEHISKIVIDPSDYNKIYVAAPGPLWSDGEDRGLYKTNDGGRTWEKILYVNEKTGCADVIIDPKNPNIIYASTWEFRRKPWAFMSGGPGSALYKSYNGGETWERIDKGFTDGDMGRICLAISPSDPNIIYAIAESQKTGLFISTDGGNNWKRNNSVGNVVARPFYFSVLTVDPSDPMRIYRPAFSMSISDDGGQSFREASTEGGWIHSDLHALWINPKNPQHLYLGTDGGVYASYDRGNNWMFLNSLPVSQFYHVSYDLEKPYNVYGGLQDNGSWFGPSNAPGGVRGQYWKPVGFGDGFCVHPDLKDKEYVYWEAQGGEIGRYNKITNEIKDIKPFPEKGDGKLRFNWNTPILPSPTNRNVFYVGTQYLYKTIDKGESWEQISQDLTTNDPEKQKQDVSGGVTIDNSAAENHCTIFAINESPLDENLIWVGTDDGNVQNTDDGGQTWTNVTSNIPGLPKNTWCSSIDASPYSRTTAYATFDGHATGDMNVYVYKTTDLGKTWRSLSTSDLKGYAHKIKQDIVNPNLFFLGTEFGLFVSIDGGNQWAKYTANVPVAAVRDIAIQPVYNDLLLATHGRGIIIIDDITPLRNLSSKIINTEAAVLITRPYFIDPPDFGGKFPNQSGNYVGQNNTNDAVITYYLKERAVIGDFKVEVYNSSGEIVVSLPGTKRKGINRVTWNMRMKPPRVATGVRLTFAGAIGPIVPEGTYTIKVYKGNKVFTGTTELKPNPYSIHSTEDRELQYKTVMDVYRMQEDLAYLSYNVKNALEAVKRIDPPVTGELITELDALQRKLAASKESMGITGEEQLREKMADLYGNLLSYYGKPTASQLEKVEGFKHELQQANKNANNIYIEYKDILLKHGIKKISREEWEKNTR